MPWFSWPGAIVEALSKFWAKRKARATLKECRTLLKRKGNRLSASDREQIEARIESLEGALTTRPVDLEDLHRAHRALKATLSKHRRLMRKATVLEYLQSIAVAVALALVIRAFLIEAFKIPTGSMIPTLMVDDHIFVAKFTYGLRIPFTGLCLVPGRMPQRGEVAVFEFPGEGPDNGKDYIKRIVALPGDRVRLKNNRLYINDKPVPTRIIDRQVPCADPSKEMCVCDRQIEILDGHEYITQHFSDTPENRALGCENSPNWPLGRPGEPQRDMVVPEGAVLAMGDNRDNSSDGRFWGYVPLENMKGNALFVWWPPGRWFSKIH